MGWSGAAACCGSRQPRHAGPPAADPAATFRHRSRTLLCITPPAHRSAWQAPARRLTGSSAPCAVASSRGRGSASTPSSRATCDLHRWVRAGRQAQASRRGGCKQDRSNALPTPRLVWMRQGEYALVQAHLIIPGSGFGHFQASPELLPERQERQRGGRCRGGGGGRCARRSGPGGRSAGRRARMVT